MTVYYVLEIELTAFVAHQISSGDIKGR
uniref:Uncharacterized protein n=1 Tax=Anguilla anguilla TaxID=7936 RepID=A0A0E9T2E2_ANGAN